MCRGRRPSSSCGPRSARTRRRPDRKPRPCGSRGHRRGWTIRKDEKKEAEKPAAKPAAPAAKEAAKEPAKAPEALRIDFDRLENRIVTVPIPAGVYDNLQAGEGGKLFYRKEDPPPTPTSGGQGDSSIRVYGLSTRKDEALGP